MRRTLPATVFVVDPEARDYGALERLADGKQWAIRFLAGGCEALRLADRSAADLWIINVRLPDMSGFDLVEMLQPRLGRAATFLVADSYQAEDEVQALSLGVTRFFCKPIEEVLVRRWWASVRSDYRCFFGLKPERDGVMLIRGKGKRASAASRKYRLPRQAALEPLEKRLLLSADFRTIDGTGNNPYYDEYGSAEIALLRETPAAYADGISEPSGAGRANPREISNLVVAQYESIENDAYVTDMFWLWGQFLDHDVSITPHGTEEFNIPVPEGDEYFDPEGTGTEEIAMGRSLYVPGEPPRQQVNSITAWIDASNVYGSDAVRANALRTFVDGKLKTSPGDLLPYNVPGLENAGGTSDTLFLAGDVRANEQVALTAMHTLFVREHNRLAEEIADEKPWLSDEAVYQRARGIVGAQMQVITYNEFLPALLGYGALDPYAGYQPSVDPAIGNEFSTAAYRLGHSMLSNELLQVEECGCESYLPLREAFFRPDYIAEEGIDPILAGFARQRAQQIDAHVVDAVRNFLFGDPGDGGFDLPSLNIQRGRDHGLPDYNTVRAELGLTPAADWNEITSDAEVQDALRAAYGSIDKIDLWVGGLCEDHEPGSQLGATFHAIVKDQFERLRDGDRFWYENVFRGDMLTELKNTTLSDIIARNTEIAGLQEHVFYDNSVLVYHHPAGRYGANLKLYAHGGEVRLKNGRELVAVKPLNETNKVVIAGGDYHDRVTVNVAGAAFDGGIRIHGGKRADFLKVHGTPAGEHAELHPGYGSFQGAETDMYFTGFAAMKIKGGGGHDTGKLTDSVHRDTFLGTRKTSAMSGKGFFNELRNFDEVHAEAYRGGYDRAILQGGRGRNHLEAADAWARLQTENRAVEAYGFDWVWAIAARSRQNTKHVEEIDYVLKLTGDWLDA